MKNPQISWKQSEINSVFKCTTFNVNPLKQNLELNNGAKNLSRGCRLCTLFIDVFLLFFVLDV